MQDQNNISSSLYGLIVCGGKSSRMGTDKSMLVYQHKPQCYHLYEMLQPFCEKVFIACNRSQVNNIREDHSTIADLAMYSNTGPMASLLSAWSSHVNKDLLIIGCDYPFLNSMDIQDFLNSFQRTGTAAAFFNAAAGLYEPLLAYYDHRSFHELLNMHANKEYSLQHFLKKNNAFKFYPGNEQSIRSIDTNEEYIKALELINQTL